MKYNMNLQLFASAETGVKTLVYSIMQDDDLETYGAVKAADALISIKVSPKSDLAKLPADNEYVEVCSSVGDVVVDIEVREMPLTMQADWFGHTLNTETGVMNYDVNDTPPYLAVGYRRTKANGKSRYVWLLKTKFEEISEESKTAEPGKTSFQTPKATGTAITNKNGIWKVVADEDAKGSAIVGFLDSVPGSSPGDLVAPTVTSVPVDAATGVLGTANLVLTFDKAIQSATAIDSNIFVIKADGTAVPAVVTINAGKTVVTVDPVSTMATGSYVLIATTGVKSAAGVALATNYVVNFTV